MNKLEKKKAKLLKKLQKLEDKMQVWSAEDISNVVMRCYQECDTKAEAVKKIDEWLDLSGIGEVRDVLENKKC